MKFEFKTQPFAHQQKALDLSAMKKNFAYFMEMGCVDGETEFLTNRGWMKFKDFDINEALAMSKGISDYQVEIASSLSKNYRKDN